MLTLNKVITIRNIYFNKGIFYINISNYKISKEDIEEIINIIYNREFINLSIEIEFSSPKAKRSI